MKKIYAAIILLAFVHLTALAQDAKQVSECTVSFEVSVQDAKADPNVVKAMAGAVKTLYVKGSKSRSDLETTGFKQTTLFDTKTDSTVILREIGNNKYISYLNGGQRKEKYKKYEGIKFSTNSEKKTILGYDCKKVIAMLADGSTYNIFYTASLMSTNNQYEYQFKDLPGFVMEYESESENGKIKVKYTASKISFLPVPNSKFDVPKSGYRII